MVGRQQLPVDTFMRSKLLEKMSGWCRREPEWHAIRNIWVCFAASSDRLHVGEIVRNGNGI